MGKWNFFWDLKSNLGPLLQQCGRSVVQFHPFPPASRSCDVSAAAAGCAPQRVKYLCKSTSPKKSPPESLIQAVLFRYTSSARSIIRTSDGV